MCPLTKKEVLRREIGPSMEATEFHVLKGKRPCQNAPMTSEKITQTAQTLQHVAPNATHL